MVGNLSRGRKRVDADPSSLRRGKGGSGFTNCEKCKKAVPAGAADVHDCKLDAKIKMSLECYLPISSADKDLSSSKMRKRKNTKQENPKSPSRIKKLRGPQEPKKPQTTYSIFMTEFRKTCREDSAGSKGVNKEGAEKWKSMTEEEKKPYINKAQGLRTEYLNAFFVYHQELRQFNEEGDSAEVGVIDTAYYESPPEDDLYEDEYEYWSETDDE